MKPTEFNSDVPVPEHPHRPPDSWTSVLAKMNIGDSFKMSMTKGRQKAIYNAAYRIGARLRSQRQPDGEVIVWRLK